MLHFLKLTNLSEEHKNKPLLLNARYIISVFSTKNSADEEVTVIYGATQNSWTVKESVDTVLEMLDEVSQ